MVVALKFIAISIPANVLLAVGMVFGILCAVGDVCCVMYVTLSAAEPLCFSVAADFWFGWGYGLVDVVEDATRC